MRCTEDTAWILDSDEGSVASRVVDRDKLLCAAPYDGRPLVPVVEIIVVMWKYSPFFRAQTLIKWDNARKKSKKGTAEASLDCRAKFRLEMIFNLQTLREECKRTICECELVYVVGRAGKLTAQGQVIAFTSVNCSHRGLTDMPDFLPANTTTLRLTGNKVIPYGSSKLYL